jgi:hypothetical protein
VSPLKRQIAPIVGDAMLSNQVAEGKGRVTVAGSLQRRASAFVAPQRHTARRRMDSAFQAPPHSNALFAVPRALQRASPLGSVR